MMNEKVRQEITLRYTNGLTKSPMDLSDEYLVRTFQLYSELQSKSTFDEIYLTMLESEIERRREFSFNRAAIDELFETC
jgi:hypothetical protein